MFFARAIHMIQSWMEYLAFLSWQDQFVSLKDFKKLIRLETSIHSADDLIKIVSSPETRQYLIDYRKHWWKKAEQDKKECNSTGISYAWPYHQDYPTQLLNMEYPPILLTWRGSPCWKNRFCLSVVGSRHPYQDTLLWMDIHLSQFLNNKTNICLASGGAKGVDQKAHLLCLSGKNPTLCFLPCGIHHYYPSDLKKWLDPVTNAGGAFISVFPPNTLMRKPYFHIRNRVLAFFSHLVFILQAAIKSGTMVTGRYALQAGTNIATIPGSPLHSGYQGNLQLINDGCFMIRDYLDLETLYQSSVLHIDTVNISHK